MFTHYLCTFLGCAETKGFTDNFHSPVIGDGAACLRLPVRAFKEGESPVPPAAAAAAAVKLEVDHVKLVQDQLGKKYF